MLRDMWRLLILLSLCFARPVLGAPTTASVANTRAVGIDGSFPAFIREFFHNVVFQKERTGRWFLVKRESLST